MIIFLLYICPYGPVSDAFSKQQALGDLERQGRGYWFRSYWKCPTCILGRIYCEIQALGETHDDSAVESHISMSDWHTNIAVRPVWSVVLGQRAANKHGR